MDPIAIYIIGRIRENAKQEALEYTQDEKSTWQMLRELGGAVIPTLRLLKQTVFSIEDCSEATTNQFDQNEACVEA